MSNARHCAEGDERVTGLRLDPGLFPLSATAMGKIATFLPIDGENEWAVFVRTPHPLLLT